ncbi:protein PLANT CADMIUM RESISTANCE 10 isoform X2 [Alnus glutinosa]|uniref:protein PLANT CADMIUM RESISTANCE 10 isoform X2 n=1 Tax=Alnus glutinosa TaxID=3517 RepID=UPI002D7656A1|nr:protein PLANT CADMIUM RESISTANCE 10 isoform X2 [Alnus glutinosa]
MKSHSTYVPPPYVPLGQSDAAVEIVPCTEDIPMRGHSSDGPTQWSSGICACFDDMQSCCVGLSCPCLLFGKNAELLGSGTLIGSCMTHFVLWALFNSLCCLLTNGVLLELPGCFIAFYACGYRRTLRSKYNLQHHAGTLLLIFSAICVQFVKSTGKSVKGLVISDTLI